jgi:hypothetical protein
MVLAIHMPAFHTVFNVSDALACLRASSRGVIRRLYACGRFKERIAVSPRRSLQSTVPLTFEALHQQMASTRAHSPVFRAFRLSSCVCVCVCVCVLRVCVIERVTHCLKIETATSFEHFARAKCWRVTAHTWHDRGQNSKPTYGSSIFHRLSLSYIFFFSRRQAHRRLGSPSAWKFSLGPEVKGLRTAPVQLRSSTTLPDRVGDGTTEDRGSARHKPAKLIVV